MFSLKSHKVGWQESMQAYGHPRVVSIFFLGFSAGLPLVLVFGTLSFWLREAGVGRSTIGFLSWIVLLYGFKWVWAPLVDRLPLPWLTRHFGRRRAWMLLAQTMVILGLVMMALTDPQESLVSLALFALLVAFASASQDIVIDAYRIESVEPRMQGVMASGYMIGYRLAMIVAGAGSLAVAALFDPDPETYHYSSWFAAYLVMAAFMLVGVITTLVISEPSTSKAMTESLLRPFEDEWQPRSARFAAWLQDAVIAPFVEFALRYRWRALLLLVLIASYRVSDIVLGVVANVFYVDMGFSKEEVATITKFYGVVMTLVGAVLGGVLVNQFGVMRILLLGAVLAAGSNLLYALLATVGKDITLLAFVISADNLSGGLATAAFIAYLSGLTNVAYSATQYALFSSVMLLFPKFLGGFSGVMVDHIGYPEFFILTAAMGLPVMLLVLFLIYLLPDLGREHNG